MASRYRIKEEYKRLIKERLRNEIFVNRDGVYWLEDNTKGTNFVDELSSECFEKVEERIELEIKNGCELVLKPFGDFTEEERELCEKALNGELVEKEKVIKHCKEMFTVIATKTPEESEYYSKGWNMAIEGVINFFSEPKQFEVPIPDTEVEVCLKDSLKGQYIDGEFKEFNAPLTEKEKEKAKELLWKWMKDNA
jgi:hypothetical protein